MLVTNRDPAVGRPLSAALPRGSLGAAYSAAIPTPPHHMCSPPFYCPPAAASLWASSSATFGKGISAGVDVCLSFPALAQALASFGLQMDSKWCPTTNAISTWYPLKRQVCGGQRGERGSYYRVASQAGRALQGLVGSTHSLAAFSVGGDSAPLSACSQPGSGPAGWC